MFCTSCGANIPDDSRFCENCGASQQAATQTMPIEPNWDSFYYDDESAITQAEVNELFGNMNDEENEEFGFADNSCENEGPGFYRKVLAIVRWRRANGL